MKKKYIIAILAIFIVVVCVTLTTVSFVWCDDKQPSAIENPGESTIINNIHSAPTELSATNVAYAYLGKQQKFSSYKSDTEGTILAQKGIIKYNQTIHNTTYKNGDEFFADSTSNSALVNMRHQVFVKGDKVVYKTAANGAMNVSEKEDYKTVYGISPDDTALYGYIMNDESIKFAELTEQDGDELTYRFVLDGEAAGNNAIRQMKEFGDLNDYPSFNSLMLYFTIKTDWTPVKLVVEGNYDISIAVLGNLTCSQNLTVTFSDVNGIVEIPNTAEFNEQLGTEPTEVVTPDVENSPIMDIIETFAEQDYETGVHFGVDLGVKCIVMGFPVDVTMENDLYLKIDEKAIQDKDYLKAVSLRLDLDLQKLGFLNNFLPMIIGVPDIIPLTNAENLSAVSLYYVGDGNLYVTFNDKNNNVRKIETIDLAYLVASIIKDADFGAITESFDPTSIIETLANSFDVEKTEQGKKLKIKESAVESLNAIYGELIKKFGEKGELIETAFGTSFKDIEINTIYSNGKMNSLQLSATTETDASLDVSLSLEGELTTELANDAETIKTLLQDDAEATKLRNKIAALKENMWLGDTYVARIDALIKEYNTLTESQKFMVLNYCLIIKEQDKAWSKDDYSIGDDDKLISIHNKLKKEADQFIEKLNSTAPWQEDDYETTAKLFLKFSDIQKEYIGEKNIQKYLEAVDKHNESKT